MDTHLSDDETVAKIEHPAYGWTDRGLWWCGWGAIAKHRYRYACKE
jgi:hypothetical protein